MRLQVWDGTVCGVGWGCDTRAWSEWSTVGQSWRAGSCPGGKSSKVEQYSNSAFISDATTMLRCEAHAIYSSVWKPPATASARPLLTVAAEPSWHICAHWKWARPSHICIGTASCCRSVFGGNEEAAPAVVGVAEIERALAKVVARDDVLLLRLVVSDESSLQQLRRPKHTERHSLTLNRSARYESG